HHRPRPTTTPRTVPPGHTSNHRSTQDGRPRLPTRHRHPHTNNRPRGLTTEVDSNTFDSKLTASPLEPSSSMRGYTGRHIASWTCWIVSYNSVCARPSSAAALATAMATVAEIARRSVIG